MSGRELCIVTGASRGIGKEIAVRLADEGYDIMLFGRDIEALKQTQSLVKEKGVKAEYFLGDVGDEIFVNTSVESILEKYGRVDVLINNAGLGIFKNVIDASLNDFKKQVNANLYGIFNFSRAVLNNMIERKSGTIINISSLAGKNVFAGGSMYSATKHAVRGFTGCLLQEVRKYNIKVAAICPGSVETEFHSSGSPVSPNKLMPEDVAETVMLIIKLPQRALASEIDLRPTNPK
ncbi:MAG TPA: SDR family NAD(P)-dependent oxidoreductase [Ignavibacteriaceae bacterium]|nr:SDR family NAD(P)-dependent oxidoreductase [Ignavibacteriaceae bacterium]